LSTQCVLIVILVYWFGILCIGLALMDASERSKELELEEDGLETSVDDAWYLAQRLEKGLVRMVKSGAETPSKDKDQSGPDYDLLKKAYKKMKRDLEEKDRELSLLKGGK
jgi:hypothetical protein